MEYLPDRNALKILRRLKNGALLTPETLSRRARINDLTVVEAEIVALEAVDLIRQERQSRKCKITAKGKKFLQKIL